ncbi:hypothetical protein FIBSPDRAFT_863158 [Athelia psychrophila]|uniref:Uncharacterized protein n=1 Tax=Athelia psychrophila TaxID=1759441 RepID=A0A166HTL6_9AGAM|nr:hypothetical protein FIBSPDRAFT_863158 [Fibularhizoctonia sp. CBS 109695]
MQLQAPALRVVLGMNPRPNGSAQIVSPSQFRCKCRGDPVQVGSRGWQWCGGRGCM